MDIWSACRNGDLEYVKGYIDAGEYIDVRDTWNRTLLMEASNWGYGEMVKLLLDRGTNIEARDDNGWTALMYASQRGRKNVAEILLNWGADIEARDNDGQTALIIVSRHGHGNVAKLFLSHGANIEARDNDGQTSLMLTSANGHRDVARLLLDHGANVNAQSNNGRTALMIASINEHPAIAESLLNRGADIKIQDKNGKTAFVHALDQGNALTTQRLAQFAISNRDVPYSITPISLFVPRKWFVTAPNYIELVKRLIPVYVKRTVEDSVFEVAIQRDVEEILNGKTENYRNSLTKKDTTLLTKLLKTFRSIDYTDQPKRSKISESLDSDETLSVYDMEL